MAVSTGSDPKNRCRQKPNSNADRQLYAYPQRRKLAGEDGGDSSSDPARSDSILDGGVGEPRGIIQFAGMMDYAEGLGE